MHALPPAGEPEPRCSYYSSRQHVRKLGGVLGRPSLSPSPDGPVTGSRTHVACGISTSSGVQVLP